MQIQLNRARDLVCVILILWIDAFGCANKSSHALITPHCSFSSDSRFCIQSVILDSNYHVHLMFGEEQLYKLNFAAKYLKDRPGCRIAVLAQAIEPDGASSVLRGFAVSEYAIGILHQQGVSLDSLSPGLENSCPTQSSCSNARNINSLSLVYLNCPTPLDSFDDASDVD